VQLTKSRESKEKAQERVQHPDPRQLKEVRQKADGEDHEKPRGNTKRKKGVKGRGVARKVNGSLNGC